MTLADLLKKMDAARAAWMASGLEEDSIALRELEQFAAEEMEAADANAVEIGGTVYVRDCGYVIAYPNVRDASTIQFESEDES